LRAGCAGNVPSTPVRIAVKNAKQNNHGKSTAEQFPTRGKQGVNQTYQSAEPCPYLPEKGAFSVKD
jgi:hypothetical protein